MNTLELKNKIRRKIDTVRWNKLARLDYLGNIDYLLKSCLRKKYKILSTKYSKLNPSLQKVMNNYIYT